MKRKEFLKTMVATGASAAVLNTNGLKVLAQEAAAGTPDLVAVLGGEPEVMFRKAIAELGGMGRFVKKGQKVVIKPNIGWDKTPEMGANTHPMLVKEMVKQALDAGAAEVVVFDHTCDEWRNAYKNSGIEDAVNEAGGKMMPADLETYYREVTLSEGKKLTKTKIHTAILDCDVWFNVPVLKVHRGTHMTLALKNYMGIVWDRQFFHGNDLQQCIADCATYVKRPVLNVIDAYRVMKSNGPRGLSAADAVVMKGLFASTDIVAVDTAAVKFAQRVTEKDLEAVTHIGKAMEFKLGTTDLASLQVKRISL
ncbi:MAG: DUF362 domain-containing protein [Planctomycetaceae bacterium]|nr:DUF362 domain-containing protein [Planctomycetaceae bacterium]